MKRILTVSALPLLALVSACGGGGNELVTTNSNNVILNDAQENFAFTNDDRPTENEAGMANGTAVANDAGMTDNVTADPAANGTGTMQ